MSRQALLEYFRERAPLVAPSMLQCDFGNLQREVTALEDAGAHVLHLDVMDGHFVPNLTYGPVVIERLRDLTLLPFDAHLMITDPAPYLDEYVSAGCQALTIHIEAVPDPRSQLSRIREHGCLAGISLNPDTPVSRIAPFLEMVDLALVMSVQPGFGGQSFQPECAKKVTELRRLKPDLLLSIDGGIGRETIGVAAAAGADMFVAGSAIFQASDYRSAMSQLRERAVAARAEVARVLH
ncbi:MAG: ribulose-phosphate 3-epimerase [Planctomycetaceae bacterium]|nr:ribulose-phosphate 3-epimerase [Planctomycetaceae bacterium]